MADTLNPAQQRAIAHTSSPLLVLAGAGSGKTRVLTHKIVYLLQRAHLPADSIFAVTFTNKAAREMRERLASLLDPASRKNLSISTFHTLGLRILRESLASFGLRAGFSIYDATDSLQLVKELMRREFADPGNHADATLAQINTWKQLGQTPAVALAQAADDIQYRAASVYTRYQEALRTYNAVDFDDLIVLPLWQMQHDPLFATPWRKRVRYLLVDEYQDTNSSQYELVKQLVQTHHGLTVVGDDDQSIYTWRGARPENLAQLKQDFPQLSVIKLEQNYRSTARILNVANQLIKNNPHLFEKKLWSTYGGGDPVRIYACRDDEHEAQRVVSELLHHKFSKAGQYSDYAILYRGNHQSRLFERTLREHNIPYYLSGSQSFFSYTEIKDLLAYLRLVCNPQDDNAMLRIINTPRREIGTSTLQKLAEFAAQQGLCLFDAMAHLALETRLSGRALHNLREFHQWLVQITPQLSQSQADVALKQLLHALDYSGWLRDSSADEATATRRQQNVDELIEWFTHWVRHDPATDLATVLAKLSLQERLEREDDEATGERVHLMTLHAAKGLEFPHVYLVGWEENLLPHRNSIEADTIEEERRLAYVGITRARQTLTLTYAQQRQRYGETQGITPSRFLEELPKEDIEWIKGDADIEPAVLQQRGAAHLQHIRAMLKK
ncbi:MAG: UvrD-helicase domain-containing protein [Gammaproteobacteria bacterium]|nr:UvrD-helicase domain-containing protein [Gammaproteobacteria bacterium]